MSSPGNSVTLGCVSGCSMTTTFTSHQVATAKLGGHPAVVVSSRELRRRHSQSHTQQLLPHMDASYPLGGLPTYSARVHKGSCNPGYVVSGYTSQTGESRCAEGRLTPAPTCKEAQPPPPQDTTRCLHSKHTATASQIALSMRLRHAKSNQ